MRLGLAAVLVAVWAVLSGPAPAARAGIGTAGNAPRLVATAKGANQHCYYLADTQRAAAFKAIADAGARWVRIDLDWAGAEPQPQVWDEGYLSRLDGCVNSARAAGLKVLMVVGATPAWARFDSSHWQDGPREVRDYGAALAHLARYFRGRVAAWEVWNEPNARAFWTNTVAHYVLMLRSTYLAIKAADPRAIVVSGGTAHSDLRWFERAYALGIKGSFDALGVHPYEASGAAHTALHGMWRLRAIRRLMLAHGDRRPIWLTEFSWLHGANTDDRQQALYLRRAVSCLPLLPFVKVAFWYQAFSPNADVDGEYALLDPQMRRRASYDAFAQWRPGRTMLPRGQADELCGSPGTKRGRPAPPAAVSH